jgi:hypothetical protein
MKPQLPQDAGRLVRRQAGVITRAQAMAAGLTRHAVYARLASGRWQRHHAGVYAAYSGPLARESQLWAAVLGARPGAVLCHQTAAELHGFPEPSGRTACQRETTSVRRWSLRVG